MQGKDSRSRWHMLLVTWLLLIKVQDVSSQSDVCGQAPLNTKTRIVGGEDATAGSWPWQVSMQRSGSHFCGGSLITKDWVLCAAHCFPSTSTLNLVVSMGRLTQEGTNANEVSRTVTEIINHPDYNSDTFDNDISLLRLSSSVTFTDYIRPICLAASNSTMEANADVWITGWGTIRSGVSLPSPQTLQEVEVPVVASTACQNAYSPLDITNNMICAGLLGTGGKDSCQGDSGGPLVTKEGSLWAQVGIVSFGRGCAEPDFPGVYARVSQYETWIKSQITSNQPGFMTVTGTSSGNSTNSAPQGTPTTVYTLPFLLFPLLLSTFLLS